MTDQKIIPLSKAQPPLYAGVDVGGTNIKFGLVDDSGQTLAYNKIRTEPTKGPDDAISRMSQQIEALINEAGAEMSQLVAVGLATPGTMDLARGMILEPPNLPTWRHYPIRDQLSKACERPVAYANDANAAAFGEFWVGCGEAYPSLVMLTLGTGVGGGIIIGDLSVDGEHSHGSECGHIIIDHTPEARVCPCGHRGHLEAYCSATALVKRAEEHLSTARTSSMRERIDNGEKLTTLLMAEEAAKGDGLSLEIIMESAKFLGVGIASLVHTIDPGAVVLGGAMDFGGHGTELGEKFLSKVRDEFHRRTFPTLAEHTVVEFAELGGDAGYIGAAGVARAGMKRGSLQQAV